MKSILSLAILAGSVAVSAPAQAAPLSSIFSSYFAFGDSLTDDGKYGYLPAPSLGGRFTNGPTYAEHIAGDFAVSGNYALGGATAGPVNANVPYGTAITDPTLDLDQFATLSSQVDVFELDPTRLLAGSNPLVSVLMGSNDIFQQAYLPDGSVNPAFDVTETVDYVTSAVRRIAALGPYDDFIIPLTPGADNAVYGPFRQAYNAYLMTQVADLIAEGLTIYIPDLDAVSATIAADPTAYGITETGSCIHSIIGGNNPLVDNCTLVGFDGSGGPIFDLSLANLYPLADLVHPSATVHAEWAKGVTARVQADLSAVPLPAAGVLLLAGLGSLALRRRAA